MPPPPRGRSKAPLIVVVALVVVAALGAGAFVLTREDARDPDEALAAAQSAADDATNFSFAVALEDTYTMEDDGGGSLTTDHYSGEGEWTEERWRMRTDDGFTDTELILDGDTLYERSDDGDDVEDRQWARYDDAVASADEILGQVEASSEDPDEDQGLADTMAVSTAVALYLLDPDAPVDAAASVGDPGGYRALIGQLVQPEVVEEKDGTITLGATVRASDEHVDAFGSALPDAEVELDLDSDDLPTALRIEVAQGEAAIEAEVEFDGWNEPVDIEVPGDDEVDESPWIDEDAIRTAAGEVTLVVPTATPEDWDLSLLEVVPAEDALDVDADDAVEDCTVVEIDWDESISDYADDAAWEDAGYLALWLMTADCALLSDDTPFEPGGPGGLPSRENSVYGLTEVQVGTTVAQILTTLEDEELDAVLASLAPADVEALIAEAKVAMAGL